MFGVIKWLVFSPGGAVAVVQCCGLGVVEAVSLLLGEDLSLAIIKILVDGTRELRCYGGEASASVSHCFSTVHD